MSAALSANSMCQIGVTNLAYDATTDLADDDNSAPYVELGEGGHHAHPVFSADDREMTPPPPARPRAMSKREFLDPITRLQERQRTFSEMTADEVEEITKEITMVEMRKPVADKDSGAVNSFLQAFSLVTNMKYVFRCKHRDDGFPAMNGLRVLNLLWLVCMHTNFYCIACDRQLAGSDRGNSKVLPFKRFLSMVTLQWNLLQPFCVSQITFLQLCSKLLRDSCGFLVCYWTVKKLNERGDWGDRRFWILNFYVHRLWSCIQ
ncbi:PREDICTED: uncharacterized protein LOC106819036 [Priapulus caudatus]|uniref:Uncharacterized protein LOC106819036 n=1 Tax=Priapulus caudatus TaxID=37621 RepID=A0ABM1F411_PRICU|nr:PREDICTED: uncharacterized protein LOC106819036 [Priapulus caudatus]